MADRERREFVGGDEIRRAINVFLNSIGYGNERRFLQNLKGVAPNSDVMAELMRMRGPGGVPEDREETAIALALADDPWPPAEAEE